jgi:pimeloyl-ACP methyl ester carboxylesterase
MRVESDGVGLNVEIDGPQDATAVVLLHGVSGSGRTFDWLPSQLAPPRRTLRVDLRGHGHSDAAPGTYLVERYGEDVVAVLRQVTDRPAVLVGHSLGAVTAWWVAQHHPELVAAAFLEDPPLYMGEPAEHAQNAAIPMFRVMRQTAARWQADDRSAEAVTAQLAAAPSGPGSGQAMSEVMTEDALAARADALLRMDLGVVDAAADRSTLAGIDTASPVTVPVFVLAADDALAAFPIRHAERLALTHPDVQVARLPGASHSIHDERAHRPAYVEHLSRFLAEHA